MKIKWHEVTTFSKILALAIFIVFPLISFYFGIQYQQLINRASKVPTRDNHVTYYAVVRNKSTSGNMSFLWYNMEQNQIIEPDNRYMWFWALPENVPYNEAVTDKWVDFIYSNPKSIFKITGTLEEPDCGYYNKPAPCIVSINIDNIVPVGMLE